MAATAPPTQLLLARNFVASILTPALLVSPEGVMTFFNEACGELIGHRFEESGRLTREEWNEIGPLDEQGRPIESERLPLTIALREGRPALGRFRIGTDQGQLLDVEASAVPLMGDDAFHGAMVLFVPVLPEVSSEPPPDDGRESQRTGEIAY